MDVKNKLKNFLKKENITIPEFAELIGESHFRNVYRYLRGDKNVVPRPDKMELIYNLTNGEITPNDFYGFLDQNKVNDPQLKIKISEMKKNLLLLKKEKFSEEIALLNEKKKLLEEEERLLLKKQKIHSDLISDNENNNS
tara:strand:+ start:249 stop:668 length:420 start_codon:yes stop_codon:yes gene_type:complete